MNFPFPRQGARGCGFRRPPNGSGWDSHSFVVVFRCNIRRRGQVQGRSGGAHPGDAGEVGSDFQADCDWPGFGRLCQPHTKRPIPEWKAEGWGLNGEWDHSLNRWTVNRWTSPTSKNKNLRKVCWRVASRLVKLHAYFGKGLLNGRESERNEVEEIRFLGWRLLEG